MGADDKEEVMATEEMGNNRNVDISEPKLIEAWTKYNFDARNNMYSDFKWNWTHFHGTDWDDKEKKHGIFKFYGKHWDNDVDKENGNYGGVSSGSNNYAPSNPDLEKRINEDIEKFLQENPTIEKEDIPSDIITASGSGLDPHISVEAANVQIDRVSENTGLTKKQLKKMIEENTEGKFLGIFGEEKVNVLELNLSLAKEISMV